MVLLWSFFSIFSLLSDRQFQMEDAYDPTEDTYRLIDNNSPATIQSEPSVADALRIVLSPGYQPPSTRYGFSHNGLQSIFWIHGFVLLSQGIVWLSQYKRHTLLPEMRIATIVPESAGLITSIILVGSVLSSLKHSRASLPHSYLWKFYSLLTAIILCLSVLAVSMYIFVQDLAGPPSPMQMFVVSISGFIFWRLATLTAECTYIVSYQLSFRRHISGLHEGPHRSGEQITMGLHIDDYKDLLEKALDTGSSAVVSGLFSDTYSNNHIIDEILPLLPKSMDHPCSQAIISFL